MASRFVSFDLWWLSVLLSWEQVSLKVIGEVAFFAESYLRSGIV